MPMHRRRVYLDYSASRRARMEGWLSLSIFLSTGVLLVSLLVCLPDVISSTLNWIKPERLYTRPEVASQTVTSALAIPCEILMTLSAGFLVVALLLKFRSGPRPH